MSTIEKECVASPTMSHVANSITNKSNNNIVYNTFQSNINNPTIYNNFHVDENSIINESNEYIYFGENPLYKCTLIGWQAGTGKTLRAVNEIAANPDNFHLYATNNHKLLEETNNRITATNPNTTSIVVVGFGKGCHYMLDENHDYHNRVKNLHNKKVHPKNICMIMNCKERCRYREQWKDMRDDEGNICTNILCTLNHLPIFDFDDFRHIFIDESINSNGRYESHYNHLPTIAVLENIKDRMNYNLYHRILEAILIRDGQTILKYAPLLDDLVDSYNEKTCVENKGEKDKKIILKLIKLRFSQIGFHFIMADTYNEKFDVEDEESTNTLHLTWHEVIMFKQLQSKKDVTFMDTTLQFNRERFYFEIRDFQKLFPEYQVVVDYHWTKLQNKNTTIKMSFKNGVYKSYIDSYYKNMSKKLKYTIDNHRKLHSEDRICILSFKDLIEKKGKEKDGAHKLMGCDAFWFYSGGGFNDFSGYEKLIVFGTPLPPKEWYEEQWKTLYGDEPLPEYELINSGMWILPDDERVADMVKQMWFGEVYNAIHRVRPLQNNTTIHWFGKNIPQQLMDEFAIEVLL